jgi:2-iminobutanoate/2-iminopropanoate deaminase
MIESIRTDRAPEAIGPYSQAVKVNGMVFASGQIPLDPKTMQIVDGDIRAQTERVLANLKAVLEAAGTSPDRIVKTTVYLADMNDFAAMNEVYAAFFASSRPARSTVQAARLPRDARVEIDVIALA